MAVSSSGCATTTRAFIRPAEDCAQRRNEQQKTRRAEKKYFIRSDLIGMRFGVVVKNEFRQSNYL